MPSENATLELALRDEPQAIMLSSAQIQVIAQTEFVPTSMRGNVPKVLACIAKGRAMGIADMDAIGGIDIIQGNARLSARLMVALVRKHGHSIQSLERTREKCVVRGRRRDTGDTEVAEWTMEDAKLAGLAGKDNWKKYPRQMLWARAVSELCGILFADCFSGSVYTPEDFGGLTADEVEDIDGDNDPAARDSSVIDVSDTEIVEGLDEAASGAVTEPGTVDGEPGEAPAVSGSATAPPRSLEEFREWAKRSGIDNEVIRAKAVELFGQPPMTPDEFARLYQHLTRPQEEALFA